MYFRPYLVVAKAPKTGSSETHVGIVYDSLTPPTEREPTGNEDPAPSGCFDVVRSYTR
jgi:hypothetical protein